MIRHIVFFNVKDQTQVEDIRAKLMMLADIPHSQHFEVGRNLQSDPITGDRVDLVVYGEFVDEAALAAYKAHPTYAACTDTVRPLRELRIAADFAAATG